MSRSYKMNDDQPEQEPLPVGPDPEPDEDDEAEGGVAPASKPKDPPDNP